MPIRDGVGIIPIFSACTAHDDEPELSTYAHLLPQSDEVAAERVAALLDSPA